MNLLVRDKIDFIRTLLLGLALLTFTFNMLYLSRTIIFMTVYRITYATEFRSNLFFSPVVDMGIIAASLSFTLTIPGPREKITYFFLAPLWIVFFLALANYNDVTNIIFMTLAFLSLLHIFILPRLFHKFYSLSTKSLNIKKNLLAFLLPVIFLELGSAITWIAYPLFPSDIYKSYWWWFAIIESHLFYSFGKLSLHLILVLVSGFTIRYLMNHGREFLNRRENDLTTSVTNDASVNSFFSSRTNRLVLVVALILSSIMILFPYLPTINQDGTPLATDIPIYVELIDQLEKSGTSLVSAAFTEVAGGDRAITLLILYGLKESLPFDLQTILKYLPLLLGPLTTFVIFKFVGTYSKKYASFSALFFVFSSQFVSGIYAGFYANWIALIAFYFLMWALLRYLGNMRKYWLAIVLVSSMSILFIHIYTWGVMVVILTTLIAMYGYDFAKTRNKQLIKTMMVLGLIVIANVVLDVARSYAIEVKGGITKDAELLGELGGWQEYQLRWSNLNYLFSIYLGGSMMNSAMLILAVYASLVISWRSHFAKLLLASMYGFIIPIVFGNFTLQARVLFDLPIHILAAIGFVDIAIKINEKYGFLSSSSFIVAVMLHLVNYLLRNLSNLLFRPPL